RRSTAKSGTPPAPVICARGCGRPGRSPTDGRGAASSQIVARRKNERRNSIYFRPEQEWRQGTQHERTVGGLVVVPLPVDLGLVDARPRRPAAPDILPSRNSLDRGAIF